MVSRDYTKEVGLDSGQKTVPKAFAAVVFVLLVAAGWFGVQNLGSRPGHSEVAAINPSTPAQH
jgi:hypothetical protein